MDQKNANMINMGIGCFLIPFGLFMLFMGISFFTVAERNSTENTIMSLSLAAGILMLFGAYQNIKRAMIKNKALSSYENEVKKQLKQTASNVVSHPSDSMDQEDTETYKPDIIAQWSYTTDEWAKMRKSEQMRRFKEGIWVSLLFGLLGGLLLYASREVAYGFAFVFSLALGVLISLIKVLMSNSLLTSNKTNTIVLTTNALIINGKFKIIQDDAIQLEYIKPVQKNQDNYLEFSLQWATRNGITNDQLQVLIPEKYKGDITKVLEYYKEKGVTIN